MCEGGAEGVVAEGGGVGWGDAREAQPCPFCRSIPAASYTVPSTERTGVKGKKEAIAGLPGAQKPQRQPSSYFIFFVRNGITPCKAHSEAVHGWVSV